MQKQKLWLFAPAELAGEYDMTPENFKRFGLDNDDVEYMKEGTIFWKGEVAYTIEDSECCRVC